MIAPGPIDPHAVLKRCGESYRWHGRNDGESLDVAMTDAESLARVAVHLRELAERERDDLLLAGYDVPVVSPLAETVIRLTGGAS